MMQPTRCLFHVYKLNVINTLYAFPSILNEN